MAKKLKLYVQQNSSGTIRRVDRASKVIDEFLKQHVNRWQDEMWKLNKGYIDEQEEKKQPVLSSRLIAPTQYLPEATFNSFVKTLKPDMSLQKTSFIIKADFTNVNGLLELVRIQRQPKEVKSKETLI